MFRKIVFSKWTLTAVGLILIYTLAGFFLTPYLIRYGLENVVAEKLKTSITVEKVRTNPYTFTLAVTNLNMKDAKDGPLLDFGELFIDFESMSLIQWSWTFAEIRLVDPDLHVTMQPGYRLNIMDLIPVSESAPNADPFELPRARFNTVKLNNGRVIYADQSDATPFVIKLGPTDIEINDLATIKEHNGQYTIAARIEEGAVINWQGNLSLNPIASRGTLKVRDFKTATAFLFAEELLNLRAPAGEVNLETHYEFAYTNGSIQLRLEKTGADLTGLALTLPDQQNPFFTLDKASVKDVRFDLADQQVHIGAVEAGNGRLKAIANAKGVHDVEAVWQPLLSKTDQAAVSQTKKDTRPWRIELDSMAIANIVLSQKTDRYMLPIALSADVTEFGLQGRAQIGSQTQVELSNIHGRVDNFGIRVDNQSEPWLSMNEIAYRNGALDLSNKSVTIDKVLLNNGKGRVWLDADKQVNWLKTFAFREEQVAINPLEVVKEVLRDDQPWSIKINQVALNQFDAGFTDNSVKPPAQFDLLDSNINLTNVSNDLKNPIDFNIKVAVKDGGQLESSGNVIPDKAAVNASVKATGVNLKPVQPYVTAIAPLTLHSGSADLIGRLKTVSANKRVNIVYDGGVNVSKVLVKETNTGHTFAGFKSFDIPAMKLSLAPDRLDIKSVSIKAPEGRVIIDEDLSVNVVEIFNQQPAVTAKKPPQSATPVTPREFPVIVQRIRIEDGRLEFADLSLTPQFGTRIHKLNGVINGLSSSKDGRASIKMNGQVDEYGESIIVGKLKPLQPTDFLDMRMNFRNLEMSNLSPYSVKFAGHEIKSGRLSMDLHYRLKQQKLFGDHKIVTDKLVLGPKLKGKGEYDVPVDLAVALLKDPNDRINLSLSVKGSLDDPNFSYGQLMGQGFGSVIGNIARAPFAAIGRLVGGKKVQLDTIGFDPGQTLPPPPEREKLKLLAEGLQERPEIKLEIHSHYNKAVDGRYLRSLQVRREIARRMEFEIGANEDPGDFDYTNADVQQVIEKMIAERYAPEVLEQIKIDHQKESGALTASTDANADQKETPGKLHRRMFEYLVEQQLQAADAMMLLGRNRSDVVARELTADGQIDPARLIILDPADTVELRDGLVQTKLKIAK